MKLIKKVLSFLVMLQNFLFLYPTCVKACEYQLCESFTSEKIPTNIKKLIKENSFIDDEYNDFVRIEDLRYLKMKHWGFDGKEHDGEMLVNSIIAKEVLEIFKDLYDNKFPIYQMKLIERFGSDDEKSMAANNTSALRIAKSSLKAHRPWHALGLAIDINPLSNPCIFPNATESKPKFVPHNAEQYLDRTKNELGMVDLNSACYKAFAKRHWEWGGSWDDPIDLHHFQLYHWDTVFPRKYKK